MAVNNIDIQSTTYSFTRDELTFLICKDEDGFIVRTPNGNTNSYGKGYTLAEVKAMYGLSDIPENSTRFDSQKCSAKSTEIKERSEWVSIGRLYVSNQAPFNNKLHFTIRQDQAPVQLYIRKLENKIIKSLRLNKPDIYGISEWPVHQTQTLSKMFRTTLYRGNYTLWADFPPQNVTDYQYYLEAKTLKAEPSSSAHY